jgi:hypothetical protein
VGSGSVVSHPSKIAKGGAPLVVMVQHTEKSPRLAKAARHGAPGGDVDPQKRRHDSGIVLSFPRVSTRKAFRPQFSHKRGLFSD